MKTAALLAIMLHPTVVATAVAVCPLSDTVTYPGKALPTGRWEGGWTCINGCDLWWAPELTEANAAIIVLGGAAGGDELVWRRAASPMTITKLEVTPSTRNCWFQKPESFPLCQSGINICLTTCTDQENTLVPCVRAQATWIAPGGPEKAQTWEFLGFQ